MSTAFKWFQNVALCEILYASDEPLSPITEILEQVNNCNKLQEDPSVFQNVR